MGIIIKKEKVCSVFSHNALTVKGEDRLNQIAKKLGKGSWYVRVNDSWNGVDEIIKRHCNRVEKYTSEQNGKSNSPFVYTTPSIEALGMVYEYVPDFLKLTTISQQHYAQKVHQVLGGSLIRPSSMIVIWYPDGPRTVDDFKLLPLSDVKLGVAVAEKNKIPVFNVWNDSDFELVKQILDNSMTNEIIADVDLTQYIRTSYDESMFVDAELPLQKNIIRKYGYVDIVILGEPKGQYREVLSVYTLPGNDIFGIQREKMASGRVIHSADYLFNSEASMSRYLAQVSDYHKKNGAMMNTIFIKDIEKN